MVGHGGGGMPSRPRSGFSEKFSLGLQGMDGDWPCIGLDQHENYSGCRLLRYRNPDRDDKTVARKRSHGPTLAARSSQLPHQPTASAGVSSEAAILNKHS